MATGQKVRVLIVDDIAETRENVRKLPKLPLKWPCGTRLFQDNTKPQPWCPPAR